MGARPSSFKGGGGYLNEVDATLVGYAFEIGETAKIKKGPRKGEDFTPLSLTVEFEVDGEEEAKSQRLLIGDAEAYGGEDNVEDDGHTLLTPDGQGIGKRSEAGIFLGSLVEAGFDEEQFEDDDEKINYEPMIGTRLRLVQEVNADKTKRQGQQKGKDGKLYDRKDLKVATVHEMPDADGGKKSKKGSKAKDEKKSSKSDKGDKKAGKSKVKDKAIEVLKELLGDAPKNTLAKSKLSMAALKKLMKDADREAVREWLFDDDNLGSIEGVTFNAKKQTLTLAEDADTDEEDEDEDDE